jgi:hypothetical protein
MAASMRARDILGPWEFSPYNPVVHTWSREELWHAKGHGTVFEDLNGRWWIIYHAYEKGFLSLGRQTLLEPLEWTSDGWFRIPKGAKTDGPFFAGDEIGEQRRNRNIGNDSLQNGQKLQWQFVMQTTFQFAGKAETTNGVWSNNGLSLTNTLISCVPVDHSFETEVYAVLEEDEAEVQFLIYYCEAACCGIGFNRQGSFVRRRQSILDQTEVPLWKARLKLVNDEGEVTIYIDHQDGRGFQKSVIGVDISGFNHNNFGEFLGIRIVLAARKGRVLFSDFEYRPGKCM